MADSLNKKRVIAFDAKRLFCNYTGLGNYSRTLVRNLVTAYPQHEYHLFTPRVEVNDDTAWFLEKGRFTIHTPSFPASFWRTAGMSREVNALAPDIFHGLSHEIPFGLGAGICCVVTFHDLIYELFPRQFGLWDRWMYRLKYRPSARRADVVVAISRSTAHDVSRLYSLPKEKIHVVYQSCHPAFTTTEMTGLPEGVSLPEGPFFLYVGSVIPRKGLDRIVAAMRQLTASARRPVVVVGNGPDTYMASVQDVIRRDALEPWFHFIPHLSNTGLIQVYDASYALIYPSIYEGFGIPLIESLFRHKPVITSDVSSLPEAAGPGGLLVSPGDTDGLAEAMVKIQDPAIYRSLSEKGYNYVNEQFTAEITAHRLMAVYESLLTS